MYACSAGISGCCWVISGRVNAIGEQPPVASRPDARDDREHPLPRRRTLRSQHADTRVVHAPGGAIAAGVPGDSRRRFDTRGDQAARTRRRDHAPAGSSLRRRCGGVVQRHRRAGPRGRVRHRRRSRHRACRRASVAQPGRSRTAAPPRGRRRRIRRRHRHAARCRTAGGGPVARLRGSPVHRRQLSDRRSAEPRLSPHQGLDPGRRRAVARDHGASRRVGDHVHRRPVEQRRQRLSAVRFLGRLPQSARLRPLRAPPLPSRVRRTPLAPSCGAGDPFRHRVRPSPRIDVLRRANSAGPRLAHADP